MNFLYCYLLHKHIKELPSLPPQVTTPQKAPQSPAPSAPAQKEHTPEKQTATSQEIPVLPKDAGRQADKRRRLRRTADIV